MKPWHHCAKLNKPVTADYIYNSNSMKCPEQADSEKQKVDPLFLRARVGR